MTFSNMLCVIFPLPGLSLCTVFPPHSQSMLSPPPIFLISNLVTCVIVAFSLELLPPLTFKILFFTLLASVVTINVTNSSGHSPRGQVTTVPEPA